MLSSESPHRGDSNEYTQHTIINMKKENHLNYPKYNNVCSCGIYSLGTQERVRNSRGNEPSVVEPLKFYCTVQCNVSAI